MSVSVMPPSSSPPSSTHYGVDVTTAPKQHLPILLHTSPHLTSFPPSLSTSPADQLCFFDLETTFPTRTTPASIIEYGCVLVHRRGWYEMGSFSSLIRPSAAAAGTPISKRSIDCNGITESMVDTAPSFTDLAPSIHALMHGRVWCGHNIRSFDIPKLTAAFDAIGHPQPQCLGVVDTLLMVRSLFRDRASGSNSMAALSAHFGLGEEKHRAVSDCRMTVEALKGVAVSLLMERELPELFPAPIIPPRVYARREEKEPDVNGADEAKAELREDELEVQQGATSAAAVTPVSQVKRGRGRPRKQPSSTPSSDFAAVKTVTEQLQGLSVAPDRASNGTEARPQVDDGVEAEGNGARDEQPAYERLKEEEEEDEDEAAGADADPDQSEADGSAQLPSPSALPVPRRSSSSSSAALLSLLPVLESSMAAATPLYVLYRGGNPSYHTAVRCMTALQWDTPRVTFTALLSHSERRDSSEGVRLTFAVRNLREVRHSRDGPAVWQAAPDDDLTPPQQ